MSLQALVDETLEQLNRTRELFGPAPRSATFAGTPGLESAHAAVTTQQGAVTENWHGESSAAYGDAVAPRIATLGRAIPADNTISALTASVAQTSGQGRGLMDGIIADTHSGIAALAPSTDTPAGWAQLVAHLQTQLDRAHALVDNATQQSSVLGSQISAAAADYHGGDQTQDQREDQRRKSGVQPVDYKTRPQDPPHWNDEDDDSGVSQTWGPVDEKLGVEGWAGAGASANAHVDWDDGKLSLGANMGLAAGLGGKISPHITIDTKPITQAVERGFDSAAKWLESLF
jgi:hypothetical protein